MKMNGKKEKFKTLILLAGVLLVGLVVLNGCKKKSEPAVPAETAEAATAIEQTICPVMGGAINKSIYTEYKGKKVYFCCAGCKEKFDAEPEKYIAQLPQFKD
jgi:YHS domain-containing protein